MKAYYGSRISPNMAKTPEGYLICWNVPIARVGWQKYLPEEIGLSGAEMVDVYRGEEDVFAPAAMASYEGKPVVDGHPPQWVEPNNVSIYLKGIANNVRRGGEEESDCLLADLIIYDPALIAKIDAGKREVSCGYNYDLAEAEGGFAQKNIRGNHVAIVQSGRAGPRVAVKDEMPRQEGRKQMGMTNKKTLWGKMMKAFAMDAEPEELAEASKMMNEKTQDAECPAPAAIPAAPAEPAKDDDPAQGGAALQELLDAIKALQAGMAALQTDMAALKAAPAAAPPKDALDELESELVKEDEPAGGEPLVEAEKADDDAPAAAAEDLPRNPIPGADSKAAVLAALAAIRPVVAGIKDPMERKRATDAAVQIFRGQLAVGPKDTYQRLARPKKAEDAAPADPRELGRRLAQKYNPHYKNRA